jgi:hypothetical protein
LQLFCKLMICATYIGHTEWLTHELIEYALVFDRCLLHWIHYN